MKTLYFVLVCVIIYSFCVLIYQYTIGVTRQEAINVVRNKFKKILKSIFDVSEPEPEIEPRLPQYFIYDLICSISNHNMLPNSATEFRIYTNSVNQLEETAIQLIPKNQSDFPIIEQILRARLLVFFAQNGYANPIIYIQFKRISDAPYYAICINHATTKKSISTIRTMINENKKLQIKQAISNQKPIVDKRLEMELSKIQEDML
jgi:hypothetical protein